MSLILKTKKTLRSSLTLLLAATALSACGKSQIETITSKDAEKLMLQGKTHEAAGKYARIGELLLLPEGVQYADEMFDQALQADPSNGKANLYGALTKVMMVYRGFIPRFEPIATPSQLGDLERMRSEIAELKLPELTQFATQLPSGKRPFSSYYDLQRAVRTEVLPALEVALARLESISPTAPVMLSINLSRLGYTHYTYSQESWCNRGSSSYNSSTGQWDWVCNETTTYITAMPGSSGPTDFAVDARDIEVLKSAVKGMIDVVKVATAYSAKDLELLAKALNTFQRSDIQLTPAHLVELIKDYSELGRLMSDNRLADVAQSAADVTEHLLGMYTMRAELCGNSARRDANRLFRDICFSSEDMSQIQGIASLMAGPTKVTIGSGGESPVRILVDAPSFLKHPPADLKALLPTSFSETGAPNRLPDPTMGGLFPNGDLLSKLIQAGIIH